MNFQNNLVSNEEIDHKSFENKEIDRTSKTASNSQVNSLSS